MEMLELDAVSSGNNGIVLPNFFSKGRIDLELLLKVLKNLDTDDTNRIIFLMTNKDEDVPLIITAYLKADCDTKCKLIVNQRDWQEKLLECFIIIKNYDIIRMMGYTFPEIRGMKERFKFNLHNVSVYVNRVIKSLYFLCEDLKLAERKKLIAEVNMQSNISRDFTDENLDLEVYILHWIQNKIISINSGN